VVTIAVATSQLNKKKMMQTIKLRKTKHPSKVPKERGVQSTIRTPILGRQMPLVHEEPCKWSEIEKQDLEASNSKHKHSSKLTRALLADK